jgi:spore maturation protein CgeB
MKFVFYTHSLVSDWNHGNAHFLRGVMRDLLRQGHEAVAFEPADSWSRTNLLLDQGPSSIDRFSQEFPGLKYQVYDAAFDHEQALEAADVVIVHEWTDPALVEKLGRVRRNGGRFTLLFHDTHHRAVSAADEIARLKLDDYDAILAFGEALRERYLQAGWGDRVFTWHEAADIALFHPLPGVTAEGHLIWIGNWGDGERSAELKEFLIEPVRKLRLNARLCGVRYPDHAVELLEGAGIEYGGWIANSDVPAAFAKHRVTVHVPRRPYVQHLPGIPTIRVFEALACGIPLVSAPWQDSENLFRPGEDFLVARNGAEMTALLKEVLHDDALAQSLVTSGR